MYERTGWWGKGGSLSVAQESRWWAEELQVDWKGKELTRRLESKTRFTPRKFLMLIRTRKWNLGGHIGVRVYGVGNISPMQFLWLHYGPLKVVKTLSTLCLEGTICVDIYIELRKESRDVSWYKGYCHFTPRFLEDSLISILLWRRTRFFNTVK